MKKHVRAYNLPDDIFLAIRESARKKGISASKLVTLLLGSHLMPRRTLQIVRRHKPPTRKKESNNAR